MTYTIQDFNNIAQWQTVPPAVPYVFGGVNLKGSASPGMDCSGLPWAICNLLGVAIPRTSEAQFSGLPAVALANIRQGDLVFYDVPTDDQPQPAHVSIWWDSGHILQEPHTGEDAGIYPNSALPYKIMGYRRLPLPSAAPPAPPAPPKEEDMLIASTASGNGYWIVNAQGAVYAYGDAAYLGGINNAGPNRTTALLPGDFPTGIAAAPSGKGYWIVTQQGYVYAFGVTDYGAPS